MTTKNIEKSTFAESLGSKRTPIQNALQEPLVSAIGDLFSLVSATTEEVQDYNDENKTSRRAVYNVRTLSPKAKLPLGSLFIVKIKEAESIVSVEQNTELLLGKTSLVVAFDELNHWYMNGIEGISAKGIRTIDVTTQEAINFEKSN